MSRRPVLIRAPGLYPDLTPEQYFDEPCPKPALTNSFIKMLTPEGAAPAKMAHKHPAIGQPPEEKKDTVAQYMGGLVHRLALNKGKDYVLSPHDTYQSNAAKTWKAEVEASGMIPVKAKEYEEAKSMAKTLRKRIKEVCQGFPYMTEVVMAWTEDVPLADGTIQKIWCRGMLDVWCRQLALAVDLKTTIDASDATLQKRFYDGYALQDAWYLRGLNQITGDPGRPRFGFLFVEKEAPYLYRVAASTESFRHGAAIEIERAMRIFATCIRNKKWPGYEAFQAFPTSWQLQRYTDLEVAEMELSAAG